MKHKEWNISITSLSKPNVMLLGLFIAKQFFGCKLERPEALHRRTHDYTAVLRDHSPENPVTELDRAFP